MVLLQDDKPTPVIVAGTAVFVAGLVLGAVMQNWDVALLRPHSTPGDNVVLKDSTAFAYLVVGLFHFGGMVAGLVVVAFGLLSLALNDDDSATSMRTAALVVLGPLAFFVTWLVWTFWILPHGVGFTLKLSEFRMDWVAWLLCQAALCLWAAIALAVDAFQS